LGAYHFRLFNISFITLSSLSKKKKKLNKISKEEEEEEEEACSRRYMEERRQLSSLVMVAAVYLEILHLAIRQKNKSEIATDRYLHYHKFKCT
jgi:hypothetical protein